VQQLTIETNWFCLHPLFRGGTGPTGSNKRLQLCIALHEAVTAGAKSGLWLWQGRHVPLPYVTIIPSDSQTRRHLVYLHRKISVGNLYVPTTECRICLGYSFRNLYLVCTYTCSGFIFHHFPSEVCLNALQFRIRKEMERDRTTGAASYL
jgi:hypothetical protein